MLAALPGADSCNATSSPELSPCLTDGRRPLGHATALARQKNFEAALPHFYAALKLQPDNAAALNDLRFSFYGRVLSGAQQQRPRERRALAATSGALGDAVGRIYVARYFPATARADIQRMTQNIINAFDHGSSLLDKMVAALGARVER